MANLPNYPPLTPLHPDSSLNVSKLAMFEKITTETLLHTLLPGLPGCLKTRPDGTILDGHHRIYLLRLRGVNVDVLPRDVVVKNRNE